VGIGVYVKDSKVHKRALRLTHKKISSTSGTEPRPETVQLDSDRPKRAERNTELAGSAKEARRHEEEASSVLQR
jgi:hypothetical protein